MTVAMQSYTGPLRIDVIATPSGGAIGLLHFPGRCVAPWKRDLGDDLAAVEAWGPASLITLTEEHEFSKLGLPEFAYSLLAMKFAWHHVPIPDMQVPGAEAAAAWADCGPQVLATLRDGGRVAMHCAAGLGRTGMIAAKMLTALGVSAEEAIAQVRIARPGAIETEAQLAYVRTGPPLVFP